MNLGTIIGVAGDTGTVVLAATLTYFMVTNRDLKDKFLSLVNQVNRVADKLNEEVFPTLSRLEATIEADRARLDRIESKTDSLTKAPLWPVQLEK